MPIGPRGELIISTLREYAKNYRLHAYCPKCDHKTDLDAEALAAVAGWDTPLHDIHPRLRCSVCGHRPPKMQILTRGGFTPFSSR